MTERSSALPKKVWLSRIAVATPSTTWKTIEPVTHQIVLTNGLAGDARLQHGDGNS